MSLLPPADAAPDGVDRLPSVRELPNPFVNQAGKPIRTRADWSRRRAELRDLILRYEYGSLPPEPADVTSLETGSRNIPGGVEKSVTLLVGPGGAIPLHLILSLPAGKGPFAIILKGDLCWGRVNPAIVESAIKRGYAMAEFDRTEVAPDSRELGGVYAIWPEYRGGRLSAWAWGFHRAVDYLLTLPQVDAKRVIVTGHSRGGKAALLAGATDDRVALTAPNNSGCGGAGCYRYQAPKSEDIAAITKNFPFWFDPDFPRFIGRIDRLPIDQHDVKALVAPRALLSTEALGDLWANPEGSQMSHLAAKQVFDFLGASDRIGIHFRPGGHEHTASDFETLMDFADRTLYGRSVARSFDSLPFADTARPFSWSAPSKKP